MLPALHNRLAAAVLVACTFGVSYAPLTAAQSGRELSAGPPAKLLIEWQDRQLTIGGVVSSNANAQELRQIASESYPTSTPAINTNPSTTAPPGWSLVTELALRAVAQTRSATAQITPFRVQIEGLTDDVDAWHQESQRLRDNLLAGMQATFSVTAIAPKQSAPAHCQSLFERAKASQPIGFAHSSDSLNTSAYPLLDELVQIAADCPDSSIRIVGHTDSSGDEAFNMALSAARANAVVAYMVGRGIAPERLQASGAGSSSPLRKEIDRGSRSSNRRIEIVLIQ